MLTSSKIYSILYCEPVGRRKDWLSRVPVLLLLYIYRAPLLRNTPPYYGKLHVKVGRGNGTFFSFKKVWGKGKLRKENISFHVTLYGFYVLLKLEWKLKKPNQWNSVWKKAEACKNTTALPKIKLRHIAGSLTILYTYSSFKNLEIFSKLTFCKIFSNRRTQKLLNRSQRQKKVIKSYSVMPYLFSQVLL